MFFWICGKSWTILECTCFNDLAIVWTGRLILTVPKTRGSHIQRVTEIQINDLINSCTHQKLPQPVLQLAPCLVLTVALPTDREENCYLCKNQRVMPGKWLNSRISSIPEQQETNTNTVSLPHHYFHTVLSEFSSILCTHMESTSIHDRWRKS